MPGNKSKLEQRSRRVAGGSLAEFALYVPPPVAAPQPIAAKIRNECVFMVLACRRVTGEFSRPLGW
jgi:hypothetical protein